MGGGRRREEEEAIFTQESRMQGDGGHGDPGWQKQVKRGPFVAHLAGGMVAVDSNCTVAGGGAGGGGGGGVGGGLYS